MNSIYLPRQKKIIFPLILIFLSCIFIGTILLGIKTITILVAVLLVSIVVFFNPFIGLLILIFLDASGQLIILPGFGNLSKILGFYIIVIWLLDVLLYKKSIKINRTFWIVLAFFLWGMLSILWAVNPIISLGFIYHLISYIALYLLVINFVDSEDRFNWFIYAFLVGCFFMNSLAIIAFLKQDFYYFYRMSLLGLNPNGFAVLLCLAIFCLWYIFGSKLKKYFHKILLILITIYFLFGVIFAQSRGAWIALVICFPIYFLIGKQKISKKIFLIVLVLLLIISILIMIVIIFPEYSMKLYDRLMTIRNPREAASIRPYIWSVALEEWKKNPIWGIGLFNFSSVYIIDPHNIYVAILCELGLIGLIIWIFLLFSLYKIAKSNKYRSLTISILLFLIIVGFKGIYYTNPTYWYMFAIISVTQNLTKNLISVET